MRTNIIKAGTTAVFMCLVTLNQALAWCGFGGNGNTCNSTGDAFSPSSNPVGAPEIDGAGAALAIALLMSIAAIVYRRVQR